MQCVLANKAIVQLSGEDRHKFLQGQITIDISTINVGESGLGCICSAKGKTWAILHIFVEADRYLLITDTGCVENLLRELNKYAVFSKVEIQDISADYHLLGLITDTFPPTVASSLNQQAEQNTPLPSDDWQSVQVIQANTSTWITRYSAAKNRFLVITPKDSAPSQAIQVLPQSPPSHWDALHIQSGIPQLSAEQSEEFVPQMMNLQALNAISFTKGCYMGQEVVARTKYLGKNKRAGWVLNSSDSIDINPGDTLELQLGENWRRIGKCLYSAIDDNGTWAFAVLPNDLEPNAVIRLQNKEAETDKKETDNKDNHLTLVPLPYALDNNETPTT